MGPDNNLAISVNSVISANLYFASWGSMIIVAVLALSILEETMKIDTTKQRQAYGRQARWIFLAASSVAVMVTSSRIFVAMPFQCNAHEQFCSRLVFGISLGVLSGVGAVGMALAIFKMNVTPQVELGIASLSVVLWTFGVGFITFGGSQSPGSRINNLYFSTWTSFVIAVGILTQCFEAVLEFEPSTTSTSNDQQASSSDAPPDGATETDR